jgi:hypothetical protein
MMVNPLQFHKGQRDLGDVIKEDLHKIRSDGLNQKLPFSETELAKIPSVVKETLLPPFEELQKLDIVTGAVPLTQELKKVRKDKTGQNTLPLVDPFNQVVLVTDKGMG